MIARSKNSGIDVRADDTTELSHCIRETDANTGSHCALKRTDSLGPDYWIGRSGTGDCDDEGQVLDHRIGHGHQDDIADNDRALDC